LDIDLVQAVSGWQKDTDEKMVQAAIAACTMVCLKPVI
jgi:hypothetical protein